MTRTFLAPLLIAGCALLSSAALAKNRHVDIVNRTGMDMEAFYASTTKTEDWEEDILGKDVVADGETFDIDIDDGSGACRYDFKAVFANGATSVMRNINVCEIESFTYTAR